MAFLSWAFRQLGNLANRQPPFSATIAANSDAITPGYLVLMALALPRYRPLSGLPPAWLALLSITNPALRYQPRCTSTSTLSG